MVSNYKMSVQDFYNWVDWEGSYFSLWLHGVTLEELPEEILPLWLKFDEIAKQMGSVIEDMIQIGEQDNG